MIQQDPIHPTAKRPLAAMLAIGFVFLGWLMIGVAPFYALIAVWSASIPGLMGLFPALGMFVIGAFFLVFGEAYAAIFKLAAQRT